MRLAPLGRDPLLSVVVPCYNMAEHTRETIESLLAQTYPRLQVIAVDDGSKDRTLEVLGGFGSRITVLRQENAGACRARNRGFERAEGELVAFLDCDDLWEPGKAEAAVEAFRSEPACGMLYHHALWIDAEGAVVGPASFPDLPSGEIFEALIVEDFIRNSTPVLRREAFVKAGGWDESIFTTADWDLWLRVSKTAPVLFLPLVLSRTRVASHYNARNIDQTRRETLYLFEKHGAGVPPARLRLSRARMHFYLSRLYAANHDYGAAREEARQARRLEPRLKTIASELLYCLGRPANAAAAALWRGLSACRARKAASRSPSDGRAPDAWTETLGWGAWSAARRAGAATLRYREAGWAGGLARLASAVLPGSPRLAPIERDLNELERGGRRDGRVRAEQALSAALPAVQDRIAALPAFREAAGPWSPMSLRSLLGLRVYYDMLGPYLLAEQARLATPAVAARPVVLVPDSGAASLWTEGLPYAEGAVAWQAFAASSWSWCLLRAARQAAYAASWLLGRLLASVAGRPARPPEDIGVAVHYGEGVDPERRSNLYWNDHGAVAPRRVLVYYEADYAYPVPVTPERLAALRARGYHVLAVHKWTRTLRPGCWRPAVPIPDFAAWARLLALGMSATPAGWVRRHASEFRSGAAYWREFFAACGARILFDGANWAEDTAEKSAAILSLGGVSAGKQRSDLVSVEHASFGLLCPYHLYFVWSRRWESLRPKMPGVELMLAAGYPFDHLFRREAAGLGELRAALGDGEGRFVAGLFDNTADRGTPYCLEAVEEFYAAFALWAEQDPRLALALKPKKPAILGGFSEGLRRRLDALAAAGRLWTAKDAVGLPPAAIAPALDVAVGLGISSAATEAALAGCRAVHYDAWHPNPHPYRDAGRGRFFFEDLDSLMAALRRLAAGQDETVGRWGPELERVDPFRDGKGAERVGAFLADLLARLDAGEARRAALAGAAEAYRKRWGDVVV